MTRRNRRHGGDNYPKPDPKRGRNAEWFLAPEMWGIAQALRDLGYVVVHRVPDDRGTVVVHGQTQDEHWYQSPCDDCGRVGHVQYKGPDLTSWEWVPGSRYSRGRYRNPHWASIGMIGGGDSVYECVWCGSQFTTRDLHPDHDERIAAWTDEQTENGGAITNTGEPPPFKGKMKRRGGRR